MEDEVWGVSCFFRCSEISGGEAANGFDEGGQEGGCTPLEAAAPPPPLIRSECVLRQERQMGRKQGNKEGTINNGLPRLTEGHVGRTDVSSYQMSADQPRKSRTDWTGKALSREGGRQTDRQRAHWVARDWLVGGGGSCQRTCDDEAGPGCSLPRREQGSWSNRSNKK